MTTTQTTMNPILAKSYAGQDPTGWLMSEKLDGVRAIWNGSQLVSRNGNIFPAPAWFLAQLPQSLALDGELFIDRGQFQITAGIVRKKSPIDAEWQKIRYCVFDAPLAPGGFENRLAIASAAIAGISTASIVPHQVCTGRQPMESFFDSIISSGGEGIMLRAPGSPYESCRSEYLLKYKPTDTDEATVIGTESGTGRLSGIVGALIVKWRKITFNIGSGLTDDFRKNPPQIGSAVTFAFSGLTDGGCPRFPRFIAIRNYE